MRQTLIGQEKTLQGPKTLLGFKMFKGLQKNFGLEKVWFKQIFVSKKIYGFKKALALRPLACSLLLYFCVVVVLLVTEVKLSPNTEVWTLDWRLTKVSVLILFS